MHLNFIFKFFIENEVNLSRIWAETDECTRRHKSDYLLFECRVIRFDPGFLHTMFLHEDWFIHGVRIWSWASSVTEKSNCGEKVNCFVIRCNCLMYWSIRLWKKSRFELIRVKIWFRIDFELSTPKKKEKSQSNDEYILSKSAPQITRSLPSSQ